MIIPYRKRPLYSNLIFGSVWLFYFLIKLLYTDQVRLIDYGWLVFSLFYLGIYFYQNHYGYIKINNGILSINGPLGKKTNITDIKRIKKFAGDYILKTDYKELTINFKLVDPNSIPMIKSELDLIEESIHSN